MCALNILFVCL